MNLADIKGEHIAKTDFRQDKAFESFVRELIVHELEQRHPASAEIEGPMERYVGDGQRDLVVLLVDPPRSPRGAFRYSLTRDELGETWYSCKGGRGWKDQFRKDLGSQAYARRKEGGTKPTSKARQPSNGLLNHLSNAGHYVFVISGEYLGGAVFLDEIAELLIWWFEQSGRSVPCKLREQLGFIDANKLADFIRYHKPTLSADVVAALGAHEPDALMAIDAWRREITPGRQPPEFESDSGRDRLIDAIEQLRSEHSNAKILRIHGPPGVGKTRTVYEALAQQPVLRDRVRYTKEPVRLIDSVRAWLPRQRQLILVVDEVRSLDVKEFVNRFLIDADAESRMLLVGTSDDESSADFGGKVVTYHLGTLNDAAMRVVVNAEFQLAGVGPDTRTDTILALSEGYPLFAVKLAEALAQDGDALAQGIDESNQWSAAQRVLAGPSTGIAHWADTAELRGRCLLVVLLTSDQPMEWELLWERHGEQLAKTVDCDADQLRRARTDCINRELLRETDNRHRYVSPANLVRILLNHYFGGPPGPDLGPRVIRHAPEYRAHLMDLARRTHAQPSVLHRLATAELQELERLLDQRDILGLKRLLGAWGGPRRASEVEPSEAARVLAKITSVLADQLQPTTRHVLEQALIHTTRRKIDAETFAQAERALFNLASFTDGDRAREAWAAIHLVSLSPTHQPWPRRFALLVEHARSSELTDRIAVARELRSLLGDQRKGPPYFKPDTLDGEWPEVSTTTYREGRQQLWELAIELTADIDPSVAGLARAAVAERWPEGGIRAGTIEVLASAAIVWNPVQRQHLREAVRDILHHRREELQDHPRYVEALTALASSLEPTDLSSEIIAQVSSARPVPLWTDADPQQWMELTDASDRALANKLLTAPQSVLDPLLEWLGSDEAIRAGSFVAHLSHVDTKRELLASLEAHARTTASPRLLSAYVAAWGESEPDAADAWLDAKLGGEFTHVVVAALLARAPTPRRFELLERLVAAGLANKEQMRSVAEQRWVLVVDTARALRLLESMRDRQLAPTSGVDMTVGVLNSEPDNELRRHAFDLLEDFLLDSCGDRIPFVAQPGWQRATLLLAEAGRIERVTDGLLSLLTNRGGYNLGLAERALEDLLTAGHGPALWLRLRDAMLEDPEAAYHLARVGMLRSLDMKELLTWLGEDRARAELVARMTNPYSEQLDPVAAALLQRFGAKGSVAGQLRKRALSSPLASSPLEFERRQYRNTQTWSQATASPVAREWARALADELSEMIQAEELRDQAELGVG